MPDTPTPELPQANVLGYITNLSTPTRVRRVAAIAIFVLAILHLLVVAGFVIGFVAREIQNDAAIIAIMMAPGPVPPIPKPSFANYREAAIDFYQANTFACYLLLSLTIVGLLQLAFFRPVKHGHHVATLVCRATLVSPLIFLFMASLTLFASPVGLYYERRMVWSLLLVPLALVSLLAFMLMIDLWRFLTWIARNPMAEKPPLPFLPKNSN